MGSVRQVVKSTVSMNLLMKMHYLCCSRNLDRVARASFICLGTVLSGAMVLLGVRTNTISKYALVLTFVASTFAFLIDCLAGPLVGIPETVAELFDLQDLHRMISPIIAERYACVWCVAVPAAFFLSFFIAASRLAESLFLSVLFTYGLLDQHALTIVVPDTDVGIVIYVATIIAVCGVFMALFRFLLDKIRIFLYAGVGAFLFTFFVQEMGVFPGHWYRFDEVKCIINYYPSSICLIACLSVVLQASHILLKKRAGQLQTTPSK